MKLSLKNFNTLVIIMGTVALLFLWDIKFGIFQVRYLYLIIFVTIISDFLLKRIFFTKVEISFIFLFVFILLSHLFLVLLINDKNLDLYLISSYVFFISIFLVTFVIHKEIINNLTSICLIFILIFTSSSFVSLYLNGPLIYEFCAGIPVDFVNNFFSKDFNNYSNHTMYTPGWRVSFNEFLFLESSHFGMIAPSILMYSLYKTYIKFNLINIIILILFLLLLTFKLSTTFLVGFVFSASLIMLFNFKKIETRLFIIYSLAILIISSVLITDHQCSSRLPYVDFIDKYMDKKRVENFEKKLKDIPVFQYYNEKVLGLDQATSRHDTRTKEIMVHAKNIAKLSIIEKPLGWGLNQYYNAFNYYNGIIEIDINDGYLLTHNAHDASNNFVKILVEFGIFGILFFIFILYCLISKKITIEEKIFLLPIILTQSIRGAGYFNGGFILVFALLLTLVFYRTKFIFRKYL
tara:strand:- start:1138 stop:2529 length:1392 start_codon:yes stop_codon:yes gene_type:complete